MDSIAELSDNTSKLLEALQLSHPHELDPPRSLGKKKMLSLNPITWQVPRVVERCCKHIETYGKSACLSEGHSACRGPVSWCALASPPPADPASSSG